MRVLNRVRGRRTAAAAPVDQRNLPSERSEPSVRISSHLDQVELQIEPTSSLDNLLPTSEDGCDYDIAASLTETKLMGVYDSCRRLSLSGSVGSSLGSLCDVKHRLPISGTKHAYPCDDTYSFVPTSPPEKWPQRPIVLRPSPESGMVIRGVRYSSSKTYLPLPGTGYCNGCTLPINNGKEDHGKCLVIDFESDLFVGTAMLRIKNVRRPLAKSTPCNNVDGIADGADSASYFDNRKRTFQGVIRGRFKAPGITMSECVTGQVFNRPAGHLPPRIIMKGAIAIISHLAPQLQARLEGDCPRFLSPLVSTAQSAISYQNKYATECEYAADESIEAEMCEPQPSDPSSLMQDLRRCNEAVSAPDSESIATRIKCRKRAYDKLFATRSKTPTFDPESEYTFEFFQHLLLFDEFAINFVRPIGKHPMHSMLNGQPLKFMAAHQVREESVGGEAVVEEMRWLWSFDLWHESLYDDAITCDVGRE